MRPFSAVDVLNEHAALAARLRSPSPVVARYFARHMGAIIREQWQSGHMTQGQFHPVVRIGARDLPGAEEGASLARVIGRGLSRAVTYQVTSQMMELVSASYQVCKEEGTYFDRLDENFIPVPAGFVWMDTPWPIPAVDGTFYIRAVSWDFTEAWTLSEVVDPGEIHRVPGEPAGNLWPCVRITLYQYDGDVGSDRMSAALGPMTVTHSALMPLRLAYDTPLGAERDGADAFISLIHILWVLLGAEIPGHERQGVPSGARRSAIRRSIKHPDVRVITLRRTAPPGSAEPGSRDVTWTCRWEVDEHYRHREAPVKPHKAIPAGMDKNCATCGGELFLVRAYEKGPRGLPFKAKPKRTLMKLAR